MKKYIFLVISVLCGLLVYGQDSTKMKAPNRLPMHKLALKVAPLSLLNVNPAIQIGLQIGLRQAYYLQPELGYSIATLQHRDNRGGKLRIELRKYVPMRDPRRPRPNRAYFYKAIEVYTSQNRYTEFADFLFNNSFTSEDITIRRTAVGANAKVGWEKNFKSRIVFDYFLGAGIKLRNIKHLDREAPGTYIDDNFLDIERKSEGTTLLGNLVAGFKIGYLFN